MNQRISNLTPLNAGSFDPATSWVECIVVDLSSSTGFTTVRVRTTDVGSASVGLNEIAFGNDSTGALTSTPDFVINAMTGSVNIGASPFSSSMFTAYNNSNSWCKFGGSQSGFKEDADNLIQFSYNAIGDLYIRSGSINNYNTTTGKNFVNQNDGTVGVMYTYNSSDYQFLSKVNAGANLFEINHAGMSDNRLGIGMNNPSANLHIKTKTSLSSDYSLKINDVSNTSLLSLNNNGRLVAGYDQSLLSSSYGHVLSAPLSASNAMLVTTNNVTGSLFEVNTDGSFSLGRLAGPVNVFHGDGVNKFSFTGSTSQSIGVNKSSPSANLHVVARDSTSSNFAFKIDDSANRNLLKVRNDGFVIHAANDSAIADADLSNSEMSFYVDEATDSLIFKVKYSTGTVKTTSLFLT